MKLLELVGDDAQAACKAVHLVELSLREEITPFLDQLSKEQKLQLIQGLCAILSIRAYTKYFAEENSVQILSDSLTEWAEWEANRDMHRNRLHALYTASRLFDASTGPSDEFYKQLSLIEEDEASSSLSVRSQNANNVIWELVGWFRYFSWHGYGQTGPQNCRDSLELVKEDIKHLLKNGSLIHRTDVR